MPNALNPQIMALSKSIMQTEGGGKIDYNAKGGSGEWGAAQWMPDTWASMSKAAGVNAEFGKATPQQQNQVIYSQLSNWKNKGYNIGQIASMWNAGGGGMNDYLTGNKGVNKFG